MKPLIYKEEKYNEKGSQISDCGCIQFCLYIATCQISFAVCGFKNDIFGAFPIFTFFGFACTHVFGFFNQPVDLVRLFLGKAWIVSRNALLCQFDDPLSSLGIRDCVRKFIDTGFGFVKKISPLVPNFIPAFLEKHPGLFCFRQLFDAF